MAKPASYGVLFSSSGAIYDDTALPSVVTQNLRNSLQNPSEAVLVSGVNASTGQEIVVTLTAARLVGAPINPSIGNRLLFTLIQGGAGGFAVTWNAVFKKIWSDAGNVTGTRSSIEFEYDGTSWNPCGAQHLYV